MYNNRTTFDDPHTWDQQRISFNGYNEYAYKSNPSKYSVQTISVGENDVILIHVSEDLDLDSVNQIFSEMSKCFPNNKVLIANEYILQSLTIIKPEVGTVKEHKTDLEDWLQRNVEYSI